MTDNHYFVEKNTEGKFAVRAKGSKRASRLFDTQKEADEYAKKLNPDDRANVERVRKTQSDGPDQWRKE